MEVEVADVVEVAEVAEVVKVSEVPSLDTNTLKSCTGTVISWSSLDIRQTDMLGLVHPIKLRINMFREGK